MIGSACPDRLPVGGDGRANCLPSDSFRKRHAMHIGLRAFSLPLVLVLASCGGGGSGGGSSNSAPTASFAVACTDLACNFTNLSTDQDVGDQIIAYMWTFGDGSATETTLNTSHTFAA